MQAEQVDFFADIEEQQVDDVLWESIEAAAAGEKAALVPGQGDYAVDPDTGEVVEMPKALQKLGWTEFPRLPMEPSKDQLADFEQKLEVVTDKIARSIKDAERYRAQLMKRIDELCKPLEGVRDYWQTVGTPMAQALAVHKLPRYKSGEKKGQYSKKTMTLATGSWSFTAAGGFTISDYELVKAEVAKQGVDKFTEYGAKEVVTMNYSKFKSAVAKGVFKDFPGTAWQEPNPLAKAKVVLAEAKKGGGSGDEETDPE